MELAENLVPETMGLTFYASWADAFDPPTLVPIGPPAASCNRVFGWKAEAAVDEARHQIAAAMGASDKEIVFTSGATESDDLAILGAARMYREKGNHILTGQTEHRAVLTFKALEKEGFTYLGTDRFGQIAPEQRVPRDAPRPVNLVRCHRVASRC